MLCHQKQAWINTVINNHICKHLQRKQEEIIHSELIKSHKLHGQKMKTDKKKIDLMMLSFKVNLWVTTIASSYMRVYRQWILLCDTNIPDKSTSGAELTESSAHQSSLWALN